MTTVAEQAARAYELEASIIEECVIVRYAWARLAGLLYEFYEAEGWKPNADSFPEWIAGSEIGLQRRHALTLIRIWRVLVVGKGVQPGALAELEPTKAEIVLTAIENGTVPVDEALADCEALSRSDLRIKYHGESSTDDPTLSTCPTCKGTGKVRERV